MEGPEKQRTATFGEKHVVGIGDEIRGRAEKTAAHSLLKRHSRYSGLGDKRIYTGIVRDIHKP